MPFEELFVPGLPINTVGLSCITCEAVRAMRPLEVSIEHVPAIAVLEDVGELIHLGIFFSVYFNIYRFVEIEAGFGR